MKQYKIKAKLTGIGIQITLYKKFLFVWLPDTVSTTKRGYEYMIDNQINEWIKDFNIPLENVIIPKNIKGKY